MKLLYIFVLTLFSCVLVRTSIIKKHSDYKTPWSLTEALSAGSRIISFNGSWISDYEFFYKKPNRSIYTYNVAINVDRLLVASEDLRRYGNGAVFIISPDNKQFLIRYETETVFRHSIIAKYDVFDIESRTSYPIHKGLKIQYCQWSTLPNRLSYVYENNVYVHFGKDLEVRITKTGQPGIIYNGVADWVYEEEVLSSNNAMWWSPDGKKLVFATFNDTKVDTFKYFVYGEAGDLNSQYPKEIDLKYPKPGRTNPKVLLHVSDFSKAEYSSAKITAPTNEVTKDNILKSIVWVANDSMLVTWLNRRQNVASLQLCSTVGDCVEVASLKEPSGWIEMSQPICYSNYHCLFTYWIGNWQQVWNLDLSTGQNIWKSRGNFTVLNIYGYDENNDKLYYSATSENDPTLTHVFVNEKCLSCNMKDEDGDYCTFASALFSKKYSYYVMTCNGPNPRYSQIYNTETNNVILNWEMNKKFHDEIELKQLPTIKYLEIKLADGSKSVAQIFLPPNLDKNKKYPVILNVYGGPASTRVTRGFSVAFETFMATYYEVITVYIDGRGSGNKGKELLFAVNNNLGVHEVEDQIYVMKLLQDTYPFMDKNRTGVWGWSYGGYMTARIIEMDSERVFQCGISVAPVTSWLYYDTIYTERYMGFPTIDDNQLNYNKTNVYRNLNNFGTHDFLLIHGSADDNVHYQHSLMLAKVLQENNILFEQMTYIDENHSIRNLNSHLYLAMVDFWTTCLNLMEPNEVLYDFV